MLVMGVVPVSVRFMVIPLQLEVTQIWFVSGRTVIADGMNDSTCYTPLDESPWEFMTLCNFMKYGDLTV
jgi:hypothetical protein